ncbi:hypothetical protein PoB_003052800 [Plakobranchus ocellatus]|uniref:Uncharacterized protein n=1 Tax=Plakobranchus ocellatus TaxID=259542 RepID=A0AAV4AB91_9GAST|nr:hypothetical protein PoB_003052800 [Plakobranchus ocellatus]
MDDYPVEGLLFSKDLGDKIKAMGDANRITKSLSMDSEPRRKRAFLFLGQSHPLTQENTAVRPELAQHSSGQVNPRPWGDGDAATTTTATMGEHSLGESTEQEWPRKKIVKNVSTRHFSEKWDSLTKDPFIRQTIRGYVINFMQEPEQKCLPRELKFNLRKKQKQWRK